MIPLHLCIWCGEAELPKDRYGRLSGYGPGRNLCGDCSDGHGSFEVRPRAIRGLSKAARTELAAWVARVDAPPPGHVTPSGVSCSWTVLPNGRTRVTWPNGEATFAKSVDSKTVADFIHQLERGVSARMALAA